MQESRVIKGAQFDKDGYINRKYRNEPSGYSEFYYGY